MFGRCMILMAGMTLLMSCGDGRLRDIRTNRSTPEEFAIVPPKPLQTPPNLSELPVPTPGAANRTDQMPLADAVAALGGRPDALSGINVSAADAALLGTAQRFGVNATIRADLAQDDQAFRERKALFSWRLVKEDEYNRAYSGQRLDANAELIRMRLLGIRTPSAPPEAR
ncbi:DUF3035 domain-containing protein [Puniceibacterium sediminis]|uniref:Beta-barrel assembly machine subunit BamF n=1 Tax=Puniceibacterium sediminis TaxID=1608407 RepID=A0A238Z7U0_9RHOB|nr:DUF3035 domain-containing protein [Puniceibacterium sediminis]SNR79109.1 Beta-barrel assembly machine subunit BamF [Puniceibacterium sediminis]